MKKMMIVFVGMMAIGGVQPALAQGGGTHHMDKMGMHMDGDMGDMKGGFLTTKSVDGYQVSFRIMKAPAGMEQGGSHHVMIQVEKDGKALTDLVANSKVQHPNEKSESKMMMRMGDWYMAAYDLSHAGPHQLMVLFKTGDGQKHFVGVNYPPEQQQ